MKTYEATATRWCSSAKGGKVKDQTKGKVFIKLTSKLSVSLLSKHRIEMNRSGLKRRA